MINMVRLAWITGAVIGTFIYQGLIVNDWMTGLVNSIFIVIIALIAFWVADKNPIEKKPSFVKENDFSS